MGLSVITSAASHHRVARGRDWLKACAPTEEILIIGATLGAANELARNLAQDKRASFGYHRLTFGQLASALACACCASCNAIRRVLSSLRPSAAVHLRLTPLIAS